VEKSLQSEPAEEVHNQMNILTIAQGEGEYTTGSPLLERLFKDLHFDFTSDAEQTHQMEVRKIGLDCIPEEAGLITLVHLLPLHCRGVICRIAVIVISSTVDGCKSDHLQHN
jgi:hypothetical protein